MNHPVDDPAPAPIGAPLDRVDGPAKTMGLVEYTADHPAARSALVGQIVEAPTGPGRIVSIEAEAAEAAP
ncbi:MAG: hypothetical protein RIM80_16435, partial [Alphaproteobacteria bacterium]